MVVERITYRVKRDRMADFESLAAESFAMLRRARGFVTFTLARSIDDPAELHADIRWVNRSYRDRFASAPDAAAKALEGRREALLEGPPTHRLIETL